MELQARQREAVSCQWGLVMLRNETQVGWGAQCARALGCPLGHARLALVALLMKPRQRQRHMVRMTIHSPPY